MKKLFIAFVLAWCFVWMFEATTFHGISLHLDLANLSESAVEWLVGGTVLIIVLVGLVAAFALGIVALIFGTILAAFIGVVVFGLSALWPIAMGIGVYLLCRDSQSPSLG